MPYSEVTGDLFALGVSAIGHGCNCTGSMNGGIARKLRSRYPSMYQDYTQLCATHAFQPGDLFAWDPGEVDTYTLATQLLPGRHASLTATDASVRAAVTHADSRGLGSLGIPRIGCGIAVWTGPTPEPSSQQSACTPPST